MIVEALSRECERINLNLLSRDLTQAVNTAALHLKQQQQQQQTAALAAAGDGVDATVETVSETAASKAASTAVVGETAGESAAKASDHPYIVIMSIYRN